MSQTLSRPVYFDVENSSTTDILKDYIINLLSKHNVYTRDIVILCIGSDRSTGDSLGPLIGYKLEKFNIPGTYIYGTLSEPVHAANLTAKLDYIQKKHQNPFILAVDASLGTKEHVGFITLSSGPLKPGLGVKKELPDVGDAHITGIVNFSGMMESLLLQTTRLSQVMKLADTISKAVLFGITEFVG